MSAIALRRAMAGDAPAIARVRIESWRTTYRGMIPDAYLDGMQMDASTAIWERVLSAGDVLGPLNAPLGPGRDSLETLPTPPLWAGAFQR